MKNQKPKINYKLPKENSIKIWFTKKEIMKLMSISVSTYKLRLKEFLSGGLYQHLTRMEFVQNSPFSARKRSSRLIHKDAVARYFGRKRWIRGKKPSITQLLKMEWNQMGNFRINTTDLNEYHHRVEFLIQKMKEQQPKSKIYVAYSFEKDKNGVHCHFILKHSQYKKRKKQIEELLRLICPPTQFNLFTQDYNKEMGDKGVLYTLKNADFDEVHYNHA